MEFISHTTTNKQIGRYQLIEALGEGALSVVYKAFDPNINRKLAIKVLRDEQAADPVSRHRFLTEAKAAGHLTHANIVTVFDVGEENKRPYIAMEYLRGETLEEVMDSGESLSIRTIINIGIQLAEALDYSHKQGVIHRDIKPGNIIISKDRQRIRITDFGIAHIQYMDIERHTKLGSVLGTPHYMSPEQIEGMDVDGRSDLFSTGILLYQLITGEKPFQAPTLTQLLMQIVQSKPAKLKDKAPDILPELHQIIEILLNKERKQRYKTGAELADALQIALRSLDKREKGTKKSKNRTFPLNYKWTAIMATVLFLTLFSAALFIYEKQVDSMSKLSLEFGGKLARFISMESAEAVLAQDWIAIEMLAKDAQKYHSVSYMDIIDINGVSRSGEAQRSAASQYITTLEQISSLTAKDMRISEKSKEDKKIFEFDTPILFQDREIGRVRIGLPKAPLKAVANQTLTLLMILPQVIMMVVLAAVWLLTSRLRASLLKLTEGLNQISQKRYDVRFDETHNDELGHLFKKFNSMAEALELEKREDNASQGVIEVPLTTLEASLNKTENNDLPDETSIDKTFIEQRDESHAGEFDIDKTRIKPASPNEADRVISETEPSVRQTDKDAGHKQQKSAEEI